MPDTFDIWFTPGSPDPKNFASARFVYNRVMSYDPLTIFHKETLSPQLLLQFSVDFSETLQFLFPWPEEDHIIWRSCSTDLMFTRAMALWLFFNSKSCFYNSSCSL